MKVFLYRMLYNFSIQSKRNIMSKLTNTQIKNAKAKDKAYSLSDGLGLSLLVNPNKSKWWRFRFQFEGKAKMMSLGTYPTVSLSEARKRLNEKRTILTEGNNPIKDKGEPIADCDTFGSVSVLWLNDIKGKVSDKHQNRCDGLLRLYALPALKDRPIEQIDHREIRAIVFPLADEGKHASAKILHGVLKKMFSYAVNRNYCETNPCNLIEGADILQDAVVRNLPTMTEPAQIKKLLSLISSSLAFSSNKNALLFMALTSLRSSNVLNARWEQIDFEARTMTISKHEMKLKKKELPKARDFVLPLATQTIELLENIKIHNEGVYIFPARSGDKPMSRSTMWEMIRYLGYAEQFTPHGFRAMMATIANESDNGFERDLIDAQLAHKVGGSVSQAYNRTNYLERRVALVQWWANWLENTKNIKE